MNIKLAGRMHEHCLRFRAAGGAGAQLRDDPCYASSVYWILATALILIGFAVPRLRPLAMVGGVVLALVFAWAAVQRMRGGEEADGTRLQRSGAPSSPGITSQAIDPTLIDIQRLVLLGGGAPFELRGHLHNGTADFRLRSVTIRITRHDCHERVLDPSGCEVLWQDQHWLSLTVEPGADREFSTAVWMRGSVPRSRGELRDSFEVIAASGEPVSAPAGAAGEESLHRDAQDETSTT